MIFHSFNVSFNDYSASSFPIAIFLPLLVSSFVSLLYILCLSCACLLPPLGLSVSFCNPSSQTHTFKSSTFTTVHEHLLVVMYYLKPVLGCHGHHWGVSPVCPCVQSLHRLRKFVFSFPAKIIVCILVKMCLFIQYFQSE